MAALCSFDQPFTGSADELVARAKAGITKAGGTLTGNATSGSFNVPTSRLTSPIAGTYAVHGQTAHFEITEKPALLSCSRIQSEIAEYAKGSTSEVLLAEEPPKTGDTKTTKKTKATKKTEPAKRTTLAKKKTAQKKSAKKKARPAARAKKSRPARRAKRGSKKR
jgi:hypothetical protein